MNLNTAHTRKHPRILAKLGASPNRQRGLVLIIVLVVMAAMTLASVGLLRSVDSASQVARNISFKRDALNRNDLGLDQAFAFFRDSNVLGAIEGRVNPNTHASRPANNYSAIMLQTNAAGLPTTLASASSASAFSDSNFTAGAPYSDGTDGMSTRMVMERMCTAVGSAAADSCLFNKRVAAGGDAHYDRPLVSISPLYRITMRTDGPRNVVAYTQVVFAQQSLAR